METLDSCPFEEPIDKYRIEKTRRTNDEWLCSLNTAERAKQLGNIAFYVAGKAIDVRNPSNKIYKQDFWEAWLKKPHDEEKYNIESFESNME